MFYSNFSATGPDPQAFRMVNISIHVRHYQLLITSWATRLCSGFLLLAMSLCCYVS